MVNRAILRNAIQTPDGTILQSFDRWDYRTHRDENGEVYMTDGGCDYIRRSVNIIPYKDLTVYDNGSHTLRREHLSWGRNYDKNNNLLPETEWILIKDMEQEHIEAILKLLDGKLPKLYEQCFLDEISHREELILEEFHKTTTI